MSTELLQGDEIILVRRRTTTVKGEDGQDVRQIDDATLSVVRVPQNFTILGGGTLQPEYHADDRSESRDRQYLVVRWPMRLT